MSRGARLKPKPVDPAQFTGATPVRGKKRQLTHSQVLDLAEWVKARRALGNTVTKAAELGISKTSLVNYIARIRGGDLKGRRS